MKILTEEEFENLNKEYPPGTRIRLIHMPDDPYPVPDNTLGIVDKINVDRFGHIYIRWNTGSSLSLITGVDQFEKV